MKETRGRKTNASKGREKKVRYRIYLYPSDAKKIIDKHGSLQLAVNKLLID